MDGKTTEMLLTVVKKQAIAIPLLVYLYSSSPPPASHSLNGHILLVFRKKTCFKS